LLEPESFDIHINTTAPIIAMLGHSEINMRVSDVSIETTNLMVAKRYQEMIEMLMMC